MSYELGHEGMGAKIPLAVVRLHSTNAHAYL